MVKTRRFIPAPDRLEGRRLLARAWHVVAHDPIVEGGGPVQVAVYRPNTSGTLRVRITADASADVAPLDRVVTFRPGRMRVLVTLTPIDDGVHEPTEDVGVTIRGLRGRVLGGRLLPVFDDDGPPDPGPAVPTAAVADFLGDINAHRAEHGVGPIAYDPELQALAADHARALESVDGLISSAAIRGWYAIPLADFVARAVNLSKGYSDNYDSIEAWEGNATQAYNLVAPVWTHCGIGIAGSPDYQFVVVLFGMHR